MRCCISKKGIIVKDKTMSNGSINSEKSICCYIIRIFVQSIIFTPSIIYTAALPVPYFEQRSESVRVVRQMVGSVNQIYRTNTKKFYGLFTMTPVYGESFNSSAIANTLWGSFLQERQGKKVLPISGSKVANRGKYDLLADYLFLPPDYQGSISFTPMIKNFIVDFSFYLGLDEWFPGMWLKAWAPFQNTRWSLQPQESIENKGVLGQPAGYFGNADVGVARGKLLQRALDYFGGMTPSLEDNIVIRELEQGRIKNGIKSKNAIADLRVAVGYNVLHEYDKHLGAGLLIAAPTGSRPRGKYIFDPVIGNGAHWEVGAAITSHCFIWNDELSQQHMGIYFDANVTHLLKTLQARAFDFFDKPLSRYMLATKMGTSSVLAQTVAPPVFFEKDRLYVNTLPATGEGAIPSTFQFSRIIAPVANQTIQRVIVSASVQLDAALMFNYTKEDFTFDMGYNVWLRSCSDIEVDCSCLSILLRELWALKGDSHMYGWGASNASTDAVRDLSVALAPSQSEATIFSGVSLQQPNENNARLRNIGIDNPKYALVNDLEDLIPPSDTDQLVYQKGLPADSVSDSKNQTRSSQPLRLIAQSDINLYPVAKSLSHTIFVHMHYVWHGQNERVDGSIGLGGEIEFANNNNKAIKNADINETRILTRSNQRTLQAPKQCAYTSASQWQLWIKGGITF